MALSSPIDISNSALLKVGAKRINSFDDSKVEAVVIKEFYERSYQWLLSQFYWGFAGRTVQLAKLPTSPNHEYSNAFALPNDLIRIERTFPNSNYKVVGNELHTNEESVGIKYTFRAAEEDIPVYFEQTFVYYLAEQITVSLTENQTKADSNYAKYIDHLKRAKSLDSQQYPHDGFDSFPLEDARYAGIGG